MVCWTCIHLCVLQPSKLKPTPKRGVCGSKLNYSQCWSRTLLSIWIEVFYLPYQWRNLHKGYPRVRLVALLEWKSYGSYQMRFCDCGTIDCSGSILKHAVLCCFFLVLFAREFSLIVPLPLYCLFNLQIICQIVQVHLGHEVSVIFWCNYSGYKNNLYIRKYF